MSVKVKICGITNIADALVAVDAGADALGFVFYEKSRRYIAPEDAAILIGALPPFVSCVGVFVDAKPAFIRRAVKVCRLDRLQFHGDETPEFCRSFGLKAIKAFRMRGAESLKALFRYDREAWLLDSYVPDQQGGTGVRFDWALAAEACALRADVILAGGLTPKNVAEAVRMLNPYALDVSSGVEVSPGKKDHKKIRAFIATAKKAKRVI